jgi:hypothetical protein
MSNPHCSRREWLVTGPESAQVAPLGAAGKEPQRGPERP